MEKLDDDTALEEKRVIVNLSVQLGMDDTMIAKWIAKTLKQAALHSELPIEIDSVITA